MNKKKYLYKTELFEIELFICIKMDLAVITYNVSCAIKPNQTKPNPVVHDNIDVSIKERVQDSY